MWACGTAGANDDSSKPLTKTTHGQGDAATSTFVFFVLGMGLFLIDGKLPTSVESNLFGSTALSGRHWLVWFEGFLFHGVLILLMVEIRRSAVEVKVVYLMILQGFSTIPGGKTRQISFSQAIAMNSFYVRPPVWRSAPLTSLFGRSKSDGKSCPVVQR